MKNIGTTSPLKVALSKLGLYPPRKVYNQMRYCLCHPEKEEELKGILRKYPDAVRWEKSGDMQPINYAIWQKQFGSAEALITADPSILKDPSHGGQTPLVHAALHGHKAEFSFLLKMGADVQERGENGDTLLHRLARQSIYDEMAAELAQAGIDPKARNSDGDTALATSLMHGGMFEAVAAIDPDFTQLDGQGRSLLHAAAAGDTREAIRQLLKAGLDINGLSPAGLTPMEEALARESRGAIAELIECGAAYNQQDPRLQDAMDYEANFGGDCQIEWAISERKRLDRNQKARDRLKAKSAERAHVKGVIASCTEGTPDAVTVKKPLQLKLKP